MNSENHLSAKFGMWALVATIVGLGILFYKIIEPFLIPLFFAAMLAMLCRPLFDRVVGWLGGRHRAAAAMTALTLLVILMPVSLALFWAGQELADIGKDIMAWSPSDVPLVRQSTSYVKSHFSAEDWNQLQRSISDGVRGVTSDVFKRTQSLLENVIRFLIGLAIMAVALFYFFADGPEILRTIRSVSPLDDRDEQVVFDQFASICRGVILGSVLCGFVQASLLAVGLILVGIEGVSLLAVLTFLCSMIPFLGSAAVWIPVTLWLIIAGEYGSAVFLGLYGLGIVSTSDNLVRAYVLHESSHLHPLIALISVIGAIQLVGMWGIFLGPLIAALFYALLKLLNTRLTENTPIDMAEQLTNQETNDA